MKRHSGSSYACHVFEMPDLAMLLPDEHVISNNIFDIIYGEST